MSDSALIASRKGLFTINRGKSGRWDVARADFLGDNATVVMRDPRDGAIYVAFNHGHFGSKLHRSDDGGATWQEIGVPVYPQPPEGTVIPPNPMTGQPTPWKLQFVWCLEPGLDEKTLWCGTVPGGLFKSTDRGQTWTMIRSLWDNPKRLEWSGGGVDHPGIHSIAIDPRDARRITLGISCGGVWQSDDNGETWRCRADGMRAEYMPPEQQYNPNVQDPHRVVQCRSAPDVLWAQHHNGIFRTTDHCTSWSDAGVAAKPSSFGFGVAVHPHRPDTAWFVPAIKDEKRIPVGGKLVVMRTTDGGKSYEAIGRGLPSGHCYDLVYRHALDIDASGSRLMFGSTTGSLWVSEDGGDSWATISEHLPPIHAVRFS